MSTIYNYIGAWPAGSNPSDEDVKAGTGAVTFATQTTWSGVDTSQILAGLEPATMYDVEWLAEDSNGDTARAVTVSFVTNPAALTFLIGPTAFRVRQLSASVLIAYAEPQGRDCDVYAGVWPQGSTPSNADVIAGTGAMAGTHSTGTEPQRQQFERASGDNLAAGDWYAWHVVVVDPDSGELAGQSDDFRAMAGAVSSNTTRYYYDLLMSRMAG